MLPPDPTSPAGSGPWPRTPPRSGSAFTEPSPEQLYDATYHVRIFPGMSGTAIPREQLGGRHHPGPSGRQRTLPGTELAAGPVPESRGRQREGRETSSPPSAGRSGGSLPIPMPHSTWCWATKPTSWRRWERRTGYSGLLARQQLPSGHLPCRGVRIPRLPRGRRRRTSASGAAATARSGGRSREAVDRPTARPRVIRRGNQGAARTDVAAALDLGRQHPDAGVRLRRMPDEALTRSRPVPADRSISWFRRPAPAAGSSRSSIQEAWRKAGVNATVTTVEFPVFQERLAKGRFDSYIGAYLDEPSPEGSGRPVVAGGLGSSSTTGSTPIRCSIRCSPAPGGKPTWQAKRRNGARRWTPSTPTRPAIFLYALANTAAVQRRLEK